MSFVAHVLTEQIQASLPDGFQRFLDRLIAEFDPEQVILFGSRARGEATEDSDTDLLIIMPCEGRPPDTAMRIRLALWGVSDFPLDLLVVTPANLQERVEANRFADPVLLMIEEGVTLYAQHR